MDRYLQQKLTTKWVWREKIWYEKVVNLFRIEDQHGKMLDDSIGKGRHVCHVAQYGTV